MKTLPFRASTLAAALLSVASLFASSARAATATTVPVGYMTWNIPAGTTSPVGVPLTEMPVYASAITSVSPPTGGANSLTFASPNWTPNQFAQSSAPYFVRITSGAEAGRTLLVIGNTADTLTLQIDDTPLDASGFAVVAADKAELFAGDTLGTLFGTSTANLTLQPGVNFLSADNVSVWNGVKWVPYYFNSSLQTWVQAVGGGTTNRNDTVLFPDKGLLIKRTPAAGDLSLQFTGRVPATQLLTQLQGGTTSPVAVRFPADATLGTLNLAGPGTLVQSDTFFQADTISIWNGVKWLVHWKAVTPQPQPGGAVDELWRRFGNGSVDVSATVVSAGTAILIKKQGSDSGVTAFFTQALPYLLD